MRIDITSMKKLQALVEVSPGNIYPGKGGRKPLTTFWLVIATSETSAHLIGLNEEGVPVSTASYLKHALRERPVLGRVDLSKLTLTVIP